MMSFVDNNAKLLSNLLNAGSISVSSASSKVAKQLFHQLVQIGLVQKRRKGAGNQFQLLDSDGLKAYIDSCYPSGLLLVKTTDAPRRVQGIISGKNSKKLNKLDFDIITLRGNQTIVYGDKKYHLEAVTDNNIYVSVKVARGSHIRLLQVSKTIITVENPTAFCALDSMLDISWDVAIYTKGKMSNILLKQLQAWSLQGQNIIHFGDYDYVGLLEFLRVLKCSPNARFYLPNSLTSSFFKRFGNSQLLEKQTTQHKELKQIVSKLPDSSGKNDFRKAYDLIQNSAVGLEQESLYILNS